MSFLFSSLLWFLPLAGLPVLIHLINLLRHRRVRWAAMEFLLQSQKRNRTWVILKQLLLLLLRIVAIAAVVLMAAQPQVRNTLGSILGGGKTHHIVLIDDSFSMSDHWSDTTAFNQAVAAVGRLGNHLSHQGGQQEMTLLLFSQVAHGGKTMRMVLEREPVTSEFKDLLDGKLLTLKHASALAVGPADGLATIEQKIRGEWGDANSVVYLVSDFREKDWAEAAALRKSLATLNEAGAQIQLIDCVDSEPPNLALASLRPTTDPKKMGIPAAGVPLMMEIGVTNFGTQPVRGVSVQLAEDGHSRSAVSIARINPGQTATADFEVRYQAAGQHAITAKLPADAVATDNLRYAVLDFLRDVPVLVIDGDPHAMARKGDAYFVSLPFASSKVAPTGIKAQVEPQRYLRDKPLDKFYVIYLLNIDRLEQSEIDALEVYLKAGGGVAFFVGDRTKAEFINSRLYRDGKGPFPVPLAGPTELLVDRAETAGDLTGEADHPIFSAVAKNSTSDINRAIVERYFAVRKDPPRGGEPAREWKPPANSTAKVVVRLRNGAPLVVEQRFGEGRVMAFLTTAAPTWNNLARTPLHVGMMMHLVSYLSAARQIDSSRQVGTPLEIELDRAKYRPQVKFITPLGGADGTFPVEAAPVVLLAAKTSPAAGAEGPAPAKAAPASGLLKAALPIDTPEPGVYEVQLTAVNAGAEALPESRYFAYNVVPEEGNLKRLDGPQLAERLGGVQYRFYRAADALFDTDDADQANLSRTIIYLLIALLLGEQLLAYSASYHTSSRDIQSGSRDAQTSSRAPQARARELAPA